jgi:hypothetical protein
MEQTSTWLESLKQALQLDRIKEFLSTLEYKYIIIYAIVGLILGLLLKRLGKYIIFTILVGGLLLYLFHTMHIITLDLVKLKQFIGLSADESFMQLIRNGLQWIGDNIIISISGLVGLIIGYKIK